MKPVHRLDTDSRSNSEVLRDYVFSIGMMSSLYESKALAQIAGYEGVSIYFCSVTALFKRIINRNR